MPLTFLHLSDIHLREEEKDRDEDIRLQLKRDLTRLEAETGPLVGIMVTGDVAYSGKPDEYERASAWLADLCAHIGVAATDVWVVPGNHDVDISVIKGDPALEDVRKHYRPSGGMPSLDKADELFERHMTGPTYPAAFFRPLDAFNSFAGPYGWEADGCDSTQKRVRWQEDIPFDDGSVLRLFGLNSALISDLSDSKGDNKLYVGTQQLTMPREDGVANVMLCHHPPAWLLDSSEVEKYVVNRADVQLFGHDHDQWTTTANDRVRIYSGALHPERGPSWRPRYNVLSFDIVDTGDRYLVLTVWSREYVRGSAAFKAASGDRVHETFHVPLDPWTPPSSAEDDAPFVVDSAAATAPASPTSPDGPMPLPRHLRYRYHRLPHVSKTEIAVQLHLIEEGDRALTPLEQTKVILQRVSGRGLADELRDLMDQHTTAH